MQIYKDHKIDRLVLPVGLGLLVAGIVSLAATEWTTKFVSATLIGLSIALVAILRGIRQSTIEFDEAANRVRVEQRYMGLVRFVVFDHAVSDCVAVGAIDRLDGEQSFRGLYVLLNDGYRREIAVNETDLAKLSDAAARLSAAAGIKQADIRPLLR